MNARGLLRFSASAAMLLAAGSCFAVDAPASAASAASATSAAGAWLPPVGMVTQVLARSPGYQAALRGIDVERAVQQQLKAGPQEWVAGVNAARRTQRTPSAETTGKWELGLDRTWRWSSKGAAYEQAGSTRVAMAQAARAKAWREQARALLERHGQWLKEQQAARVWAEQARLLDQQLAGVTRRRELGDAARIDEQVAEAAQLQTRAQAQAAQRRAAMARDVLLQEFPGLELPPPAGVVAPSADQLADVRADAQADADWLAAQLAASADVELARRESQAALAQLGVDRAELRPDPTVGLRVGQARSGGEHFVGVALSLPFGGAHRSAVADAAAARAEAAALRLAEAERRARADALLHLREARSARELWQDQAAAAQRLDQVARGLQRAYQLGEGSMSEVMAARRLAIDQQLAAAASAVDAWLAQQRLALEGGSLWPEVAASP